MKKLAFYISGFGFGHLTRSIALVQELLRQRRDIHITVKCHAQHMTLVLASFREQVEAVTVLPFDLGFQICFDAQAARVDYQATLESVRSWLEKLEFGAETEAAACRGAGYSLVLSDIVPEAFVVANKLTIPSIGISNFTWYELCREYVGAEWVAGLKIMYQMASTFFEYPLSTVAEIPIANKQPVGLLSRPRDQSRIRELRAKYKRPGRLLLFLSIGGALSLQNLSLSPERDYLYTRGIDLVAAENATPIPEDTLDTQNYLAACDAVVTKCGWSTVAEALIARKPLYLLTSRDGWMEEKYMLKELAGLGVAQVIEPSEQVCLEKDLFANIDRLQAAYATIPERYTDQARKIAGMVLSSIGCNL
jgi:hypothetical protein